VKARWQIGLGGDGKRGNIKYHFSCLFVPFFHRGETQLDAVIFLFTRWDAVVKPSHSVIKPSHSAINRVTWWDAVIKMGHSVIKAGDPE
jgi:hypothetical protein